MQENPLNQMNENSILLTNFPASLNVTDSYISELCNKSDSQSVISKIHI